MERVSMVFVKALMGAMLPSDEEMCSVTAKLLSSRSMSSSAAPCIPFDVLNPLLTKLQMRTNDDVGLLAYAAAHPGHLGALGYAIMSGATVHCALKHMVDYHTVIGTGFSMFLDQKETTLRIAGSPVNPHTEGLHRVFEDAVLSITLGLLHWLTPGVNIMPIQTELSYKKPEDTAQLERVFGPNLVFSSPVTSMTFKREDTNLPLLTFDPSLHHLHNDYLQKNIELANDNVSSLIMSAIFQHLNDAKPLVMANISTTVGLSQHRMIRALESEGKSFQGLVDIARRKRSTYLLKNTLLSLKQITYQVGFKNQSSFNKACERWFGMSPGRYRRVDCTAID